MVEWSITPVLKTGERRRSGGSNPSLSAFLPAVAGRSSDRIVPGALVQLVRISPCHGGGHGFESRTHRTNTINLAKIAQLVEHDLAKVGVAGSSPVFRSSAQMAESVDALVSNTNGEIRPGSTPGLGTSR